jgi:hypothetical protein
MVWSRALSEAEFDAVTAYFATRYGLGRPSSPPPPLPPPSPPPPSPPPLPAAAAKSALPGLDALYSWHSGSSWQVSAPLQWDDLSGNARHGMASGSGFTAVVACAGAEDLAASREVSQALCRSLPRTGKSARWAARLPASCAATRRRAVGTLGAPSGVAWEFGLRTLG